MRNAYCRAMRCFPKQIGPVATLSRALQLPYQTVASWKRRGVPAERVIDVGRVTGVRRHAIRPDLYPPTGTEGAE